MNILVCVKQVLDLNQIRIKADTGEPVISGVPYRLSEFDKNALEAAITLKEKHGGKVTALSFGTSKLKETIKEALAMGADEAMLIVEENWAGGDPGRTAGLLSLAIQKLGAFDLILVGEGSADNYSGQVGPRLAERLGIPQVTYVRVLEFVEGKILATRDLEDCYEVVESPLGILVSATSELNSPRLPSLMKILAAGKKPLTITTPAELQEVRDGTGVEPIRNVAPPLSRKRVLLEGNADKVTEELVLALQNEGVLRR